MNTTKKNLKPSQEQKLELSAQLSRLTRLIKMVQEIRSQARQSLHNLLDYFGVSRSQFYTDREEKQWRHSQQITELQEGSPILTVSVAEPLEALR
jgi:hypothetical protein